MQTKVNKKYEIKKQIDALIGDEEQNEKQKKETERGPISATLDLRSCSGPILKVSKGEKLNNK